jgi:hypothetical protein
MEKWGLCLLVQLYLMLGVSGLIWPDRMMSTFELLMFPWAANHRVIRANGVIAVATYLIVLFRLTHL